MYVYKLFYIHNLYLMTALYTLWSHVLKLKFPSFIGIYTVMKLQYDYKRLLHLYCICALNG